MPEAWSESPVKGKIDAKDLPNWLDIGEDRGNDNGCLDWLFTVAALVLAASAVLLLIT